MNSFRTRILFLFFLLPFITVNYSYAATERRTALVIGNSAYDNGILANPVNDAGDMANALKRLGFEVMLKKNIRHRDMEDAIETFGNRLKRGGVGLFYYAGHGIQINGVNYLIPVGAKIKKESDVKFEAVDANRILDEMGYANNGLNIIVLDACRDNPFARSFRSSNRGLAIISGAPEGSFISYATGPGQVAQDGEKRNSPYTAALLKYMNVPGLPIEQVFKNVRISLESLKQTPWELSSLKGEFFFTPGLRNQLLEQSKISQTHSDSNRPDISITGQPAKTQEDSQRMANLTLAQQAFNEKKFAEPEGKNTIEYLRKILTEDPGNAAALDLEKRAIAAYENEAVFAAAMKNEKRALEIYQRLFSLYPEKKQYLDEFVKLETAKLETTKLLDISGSWHPEHAPGNVFINSDGTCVYKGFLVVTIGGKWKCTDPRKRIFSIVWNHGYTDVMTLSADGQRLEGVNNNGDPVSFARNK
ncbi:MAG: caspase family protein [Smithellaceae bacterium]